nr:T9SS type A sorting domain-containing protein [Bacteroidota bacterium]
MKTNILQALGLPGVILLLTLGSSLSAQNLLNNPESVVFDPQNNRYLVSNWGDGSIVQIDSTGQQSYFSQVLSSTAGITIVGETVFVSSNEEPYAGIIGFDLTSAEMVFDVEIPGSELLNDITSDNSGNLYVTDSDGNKIYRVMISTANYSIFVDSALNYPNGIAFDEINNRLLALNSLWTNQPIIAINLEDSTHMTVVETNISSTDGLVIDQFGDVYFSSWTTDNIYKYDPSFTNPPEVISGGHNNPADIGLNKISDILAIPCFNGNSVYFLPVAGNVIHVPGDQPTIQDGIYHAQDGDTVLVAPGTYFENIDFIGKNIVVASHYVLDDEINLINETIINGSNSTNPDTASCVRFLSGENSFSTLQGFTLTGGIGTIWIDPQFPGSKWRSGGGVLSFQSSPTIKNNLFIENHVTNTMGVSGAQGGGMTCFDGNPLIINNVFMQNEARYGAGLVVDYSGSVIRNNIFYANYGGQSYGGGGIWTIGNGNDPILIENNTIVGNSVTGSGYGGKGGALYVWMGVVTARNNIMWGNTQSQGGPVALVDGGVASISYSDIEGGFQGVGNIDQDPAFDDMNFYLLNSSPCIDAGNAGAAFNDPEDPLNPGQALWPAKGNLRNDMGAYGGPFGKVLADIAVGINEDFCTDTKLSLPEIYPNPFSSFTSIFLHDIENLNGNVKIEIYNMVGQKVHDFNNLKPDEPVIWNGNDDQGNHVNPGIYFLKIKYNSFEVSSKIIKR